jgi:hypothetical protein
MGDAGSDPESGDFDFLERRGRRRPRIGPRLLPFPLVLDVSCNEFESDLLLGRKVDLIPVALFTQLGNELSDVRKDLTRLIQVVDPKNEMRSRG